MARIAVAGFGSEGRSSYEYWTSLGFEVDILDESESLGDVPEGASVLLGRSAYSALERYDFVVRTAGLAPRKLNSASKVWSATNEFFKECSAPIVGVTGSKGKGTTSSLIAAILRADGKKVHLVGNIGIPALGVLSEIEPDDVVVYEMSSFQLWDIESSPHVAVILHIEPDHLDVHSSFEEYLSAKSRIVKFQSEGDVAVVHPTNKYSQEIVDMGGGQGGRVMYGEESDRVGLPRSFFRDGYFYTSSAEGVVKACSVDSLQLPGQHNIDNANAAITAALQVGVSVDSIGRGLESFKGLDHRLKFVAERSGVKYYDDSIATTPGSSMAAIRSFSEPKVLILGGSSKGADFAELASVVRQSDVRQVLLVGEEAGRIEGSLLRAGVSSRLLDRVSPSAGMDEIVSRARRSAMEGDVVLLSPACASFGQFKNYQDRGDQFIEAVRSGGGLGESA